jgi:hypothetical protein
MREGFVAVMMLVVLLVPPAGQAGAETLSSFYGGASSISLEFPDEGGDNSSAAVVLPRDDSVSSVYLDIEGRPATLENLQSRIDFKKPRGSSAWTGSAGVLPPDKKPQGYKELNVTRDGGLPTNWDDLYLWASGSDAAACHLFEFDVSWLSVKNFTLYWKGMGTAQPGIGISSGGVRLYIYDAAAGRWEEYHAFSQPGAGVPDEEVTFDESAEPGRYIDVSGRINMMAAAHIVFESTTMNTDYVSLSCTGRAVISPENVSLDIGADGSVEWRNEGRLDGRVSLSGAALVEAVRLALYAGSTAQVRIPFKFSCKSAGILLLSNLSIVHAPWNLPPEAMPPVPLIELDEEGNGTGLLDLWEHFSDDGGTANLTLGIVYQQDSSKVLARMNPDGHRVDFQLPTPYWYGEQKFRARATDQYGLWTETQNFTVRVRFVNHPPVLRPVGAPSAVAGIPFEWTFRASDPDMQFNPEEGLAFSLNSSLLVMDPGTGRATFTPQKRDIGDHPMMVTVTDHYGASASRNFTLRVENENSPPRITDNATAFAVEEDSRFSHRFTAEDPDIETGQDSLFWSVNTTLFTISPDGWVNWTPDDRDIGTHRFKVMVTDRAGLYDEKNLTIDVSSRDEPPVILPLANMTVDEDRDVKFKINVTDQDAGDTFTYSSDWPLLSINATGWATFRADDRDIGAHIVTITVRDRSNLTATATMTITVRAVNEAPSNVTIVSPANGTKFKQGALVMFGGNASDEDGDALNYTWLSDGMVIGHGKSFSTKALGPGKHEITLSVSDGSLTASSAPVQIEITKKPAPAAKGFLPGFEAAAVCAGLLGALVLAWRRRA